MGKSISFTKFAARVGVSRSAISHALANGKLTPALRNSPTGRQVLDEEQALELWAHRVRPRVDAPRPAPSALTAEELRQLERGDFDDLGGK